MVGTAGVEGGLAVRTDIIAIEVAGDAKGAVAIATVDGLVLKAFDLAQRA